MKSIILVGKDGSEFFMGLVPASFDVHAWAREMQRPFKLLQIAAVKVRDVATG